MAIVGVETTTHVSIGGTGTGPDIEGGVEIVARPRDIGRPQVALQSTGTDNESEGRVFIARPRNIGAAEEGGTEMAAHARDINGASQLGPKGAANLRVHACSVREGGGEEYTIIVKQLSLSLRQHPEHDSLIH